ncbi:hypothetical protein ANTRET_LOCUS4942 [Anthophora retusa]
MLEKVHLGVAEGGLGEATPFEEVPQRRTAVLGCKKEQERRMHPRPYDSKGRETSSKSSSVQRQRRFEYSTYKSRIWRHVDTYFAEEIPFGPLPPYRRAREGSRKDRRGRKAIEEVGCRGLEPDRLIPAWK